MSLMPETETVKTNTATTILAYFNNGIIKIFDLKPLLSQINNNHPTNIKLNPEGAILNGNITISDYDLWAKSKFFGWNK